MVAGLKGYGGNLDYPRCILTHELHPFALRTCTRHYITRLHYLHMHIITLRVCITYMCTSLRYAFALCTPALVARLKGYGGNLDYFMCILTHELHPFALLTRTHHYVTRLHNIYMHVIMLPVCIMYMHKSLCCEFALHTRARCFTQTHTSLRIVAHDTHNINIARYQSCSQLAMMFVSWGASPEMWGEVLRCLESNTFDHIWTSLRSYVQWYSLQNTSCGWKQNEIYMLDCWGYLHKRCTVSCHRWVRNNHKD